MSEFQERVVGFEMEYSPSLRYLDEEGAIVDSIGILVTGYVHRKYLHDDSGFLENGFRAYTDGVLTEICTPESHPDQVGILQLESEKIAMAGVQMVAADESISATKDVVAVEPVLPLRVASEDSVGGFHENYQCMSDDRDSIANRLEVFAASAGVWTGQGFVHKERKGFQTTQKVGRNNRGLADLVELKSDSGEHRYEFRYMNYPTLHWQLKHRPAYISALIRALELGVEMPVFGSFNELTVHQSQQTAMAMSHNPTAPLMNDPEERSAVTFQAELANQLADVSARFSFPDYEIEAAHQVAEVLQHMADGNVAKVYKKVPWVIKRIGVRDGWSSIEDIRIKPDDVKRAGDVCFSFDSLGEGMVLENLRSRDEIYSDDEVARSVTKRLNRLEVSRRRGESVVNCQKSRHRKIVNHNWMTDASFKYDRAIY